MSHQCFGPDCQEVVGSDVLMCAKHWFQVPDVIRRDVWRTWRAVQRNPTDETVAAHQRACQNAAESLVPRKRPDRCPVCGGLNPGDVTHTRCASNGYEGLG